MQACQLYSNNNLLQTHSCPKDHDIQVFTCGSFIILYLLIAFTCIFVTYPGTTKCFTLSFFEKLHIYNNYMFKII